MADGNGRTDNQVLSREPITVRFGSDEDTREYQVKPKPRSGSRKFREGVGKVFDGLDDLAEVAGGIIDTKGVQNVGLERVITTIKGLLSTKPDQALDLVFDYATELQEDRKWIDDNGYDDQFVTALIEIGRLVYGPFVGALPLAGLSLSPDKKSESGSPASQT